MPWFVFQLKDSNGNIWQPSFEVLPRYRFINRVTFITTLLENCARALNKKPDMYQEAVHWFQSALIEIFSQHAGIKEGGTHTGYEYMIDEICSMIRKHPERRYSLASLAELVHITPDYFIRIFKTIKRITPGEYIIRSRMEKARNLLLFSNHPISRISEILGYNDPYFFSRQFKAKNNISPLGYRDLTNQELLQHHKYL